MQRYFLDEAYQPVDTYLLSADDVHHAKHVMRMKEKDQCFLTFKDKTTLIAEVTSITESDILLKEIKKELLEKELPYQVSIACGFTKGDKLEWVAQKATELGMSELIGFPSETSVVKWDEKKLAKKELRLKKIVKEAAEQSHRQQIPNVQLFSKFSELIDEAKKFQQVVIAYEESSKEGETKQFVRVLQNIQPGEKIVVIFGPEGGFSPSEIELFKDNNCVLCGLGPRILRAETAPLYALSAMSYQWELLIGK